MFTNSILKMEQSDIEYLKKYSKAKIGILLASTPGWFEPYYALRKSPSYREAGKRNQNNIPEKVTLSNREFEISRRQDEVGHLHWLLVSNEEEYNIVAIALRENGFVNALKTGHF